MYRPARFLMKLGLITALLVSSLAHALPPQAEADMLQQEIGSAIRAGQFKGLQEKFQRVADLKVKVPESFEFHWGRVSYENAEFANAEQHLNRYITAHGRSGKFYDDALALYSKTKQQLAEQQRAIAEREAQKQLQAREEEMYRSLPIPPRSDEGQFAEVWDVLESAPAYLRFANLVKRRPVVYSYDYFRAWNEGNKYRAKYTTSFRPGKSGVDHWLSIADDFRMYSPDDRRWGEASVYRQDKACLFGCLIMIDTVLANKSPRYVMKDLVIKGSLFPLRVGQSMSLSYKLIEFWSDPKKTPEVLSHTESYEIVGKIPASTLSAALAGDAWVVNSGDKKVGYFLGDAGYFVRSSDHLLKDGLNDITDVSDDRKTTYSNRRIKLGD